MQAATDGPTHRLASLESGSGSLLAVADAVLFWRLAPGRDKGARRDENSIWNPALTGDVILSTNHVSRSVQCCLI